MMAPHYGVSRANHTKSEFSHQAKSIYTMHEEA